MSRLRKLISKISNPTSPISNPTSPLSNQTFPTSRRTLSPHESTLPIKFNRIGGYLDASVRYGAGRGGFYPRGPRRYTGLGGLFCRSTPPRSSLDGAPFLATQI